MGTETTLCFNSCPATRTTTGRVVSGKNFSLFRIDRLARTRGGRTRRVRLCVSFSGCNVSHSGFVGNVFDCRSL